jgi:hypothetical protein
MSEWYEKPYPKAKNPPKIAQPRVLYPATHSKGQSDPGPDVVAYKRAVSRGGRWPWDPPFSDDYIRDFANGVDGGKVKNSGIRGVQRQQGIEPTGTLGKPTFEALRTAAVPPDRPNSGEPLFDSVCLDLLNDAIRKFGTVDDPKDEGGAGADALVEYARSSITNEPKIHYEQERPMKHLGIPPSKGFTTDCSGHATSCFYEADWPDPNDVDYNGTGYTGTLKNNPKVGAPYQIGDLAIYGSSWDATSHVCTCFEEGSASSSAWCSHGSEAAPYAVVLHYRDDLLGVVRPPKK